jgi:hypothetical protein
MDISLTVENTTGLRCRSVTFLKNEPSIYTPFPSMYAYTMRDYYQI